MSQQYNMLYAVHVDEHDMVWLSHIGANAMLRFDPCKNLCMFSLPSPQANAKGNRIL